MKELSSKQYEQIGVAIKDARLAAPTFQAEMEDLGRAAYAASFPHAVAEALQDPSDFPTERDSKGVWVSNKEDVRRFLRHRRARLTANPDAAVEAVTELLVGARKSGREFSATELVAAVDAARAKEPRS